MKNNTYNKTVILGYQCTMKNLATMGNHLDRPAITVSEFTSVSSWCSASLTHVQRKGC
jgi:hypothetical protein